jgi:hypothetical protein
MNRFLDVHGVLDSDYEQAARRNARFASVLLPDRAPTPLAGSALVIIDSSESPTMQGSTSAPQQATIQQSAPSQPSRPPAGANAKGKVERHGAWHRSHQAGVHKRHRGA